MKSLINNHQYDEIALTEVTTHSTVTVDNISVSSEATFYIDSFVDLTVTETTDKYISHVFEKLTYSITVLNKGPQNSTNVILTDTLPSNVDLSSTTLSQGSYSLSDGKLTCYLGTINKNQSVYITIVIIPKAQGLIKNFIFVTCKEHDVNLNNNFHTKITKISPLDR